MKQNRGLGAIVLGAMLFAATSLAVGQDGDMLTNKQIMAKINGPKGIFASLKKGLSQPDPDWTALAKQSKDMVSLTEGLTPNTPRKGDKSDWEKQTEAYTKSAKSLAEATDKMDLKNAKAAQQLLATACTGCHKAHK